MNMKLVPLCLQMKPFDWKSALAAAVGCVSLFGGLAATSFAQAKEVKLPVLIAARHVDPAVEKDHPRPTPAKPAYYLPISGGFVQRGAVYGGQETPVGLHEVWPALQKALAKQGYLVTGKNLPPPTLILTFHWGTLYPERMDALPATGDDGEDIGSGEVITNLREMLAATGGNRLLDSNLRFERDDAMERASEDRYFLVVTAYDFAAAMQKPRKKKMVWQAVLSVPAARTSLAAAIGPMISAGASSFGRDGLPKEIATPFREGRVEVGPLEVVDHPTDVPPARGDTNTKKKR